MPRQYCAKNVPTRKYRLEALAVEVITVLAERDATIAATEQHAGAALHAMINDENLTVSETVQWCAGTISRRLATRLGSWLIKPTISERMTLAPDRDSIPTYGRCR
jgi:hypothetical protein